MGMDVGTKSGGPMASMNVIPLIDILLVLIIIFMVITPLTPKGLPALVPQPTPPDAKPEAEELSRKTVVAQVLDNNIIKINEDSVDWTTLGPRLNDIFKLRAEKI